MKLLSAIVVPILMATVFVAFRNYALFVAAMIGGFMLPDQLVKDLKKSVSCWLLAAIQPFTAQMVSSVYTETPTMFLVFVGVWLLFIPIGFVPRAIGSAFLGAASLLRIDVLILNIVTTIDKIHVLD